MALARNYQADGQADQAIEAYMAYLESSPRGDAVAAIEAAVVQLGGTLPEPAAPRFPGNIQVSQQ